MAEPQVELHHVHDFTLRAPGGPAPARKLRRLPAAAGAQSSRGGNPFEVELSATFVHESGAAIENVPGFYDGDGAWLVRFRPTREGIWRARTSSPARELDRRELGPITCVPGANPNVHGQIVIDRAHPTRFAFEDGSRCVPLGFECDWLFSVHQSKPARARSLIDLLAERGFNYIVTNVYAHTGFSDAARDDVYGPPAMYVFGGTNDAPDHSRLNVDFFRDYDGLLSYLHANGIVAHLMVQVQNKKVNWPARRSREDDMFWRYVVARFQAFPNVVWDVGKECCKLLKETGSHDYVLERIRLIREADAYSHLVTVHDPVANSAGTDSPVDDACDFVSDQVHLGEAGRYSREAAERVRLAAKPYLNIEYGYEEGVDAIETYTGRTTAPWQDVLLWTWAIYLGGGYPCYYYSNTAWDLVKPDPEPPGWRRYRHLAAFLARLDLGPMRPESGATGTGLCLAEPGRQYLALLPGGGDLEIDLSAVPERARADVEWMDIRSGERARSAVDNPGRATRLGNPFPGAATPCVVAILRQD